MASAGGANGGIPSVSSMGSQAPGAASPSSFASSKASRSFAEQPYSTLPSASSSQQRPESHAALRPLAHLAVRPRVRRLALRQGSPHLRPQSPPSGLPRRGRWARRNAMSWWHWRKAAARRSHSPASTPACPICPNARPTASRRDELTTTWGLRAPQAYQEEAQESLHIGRRGKVSPVPASFCFCTPMEMRRKSGCQAAL